MSKFISELDLNDPADKRAMNMHAVGNEEGIERGNFSEYTLRYGKVHYDRIRTHLTAIEKDVMASGASFPGAGKEAADMERARINSILRSANRETV